MARLEELAGGGVLKVDLLGLFVSAFGDLDRLIKALQGPGSVQGPLPVKRGRKASLRQ